MTGGSWGLARFVAVRLAATVALLLVASFVVFGLLHLTPGDPARNLLGPRTPDPETLAQIRAQYHLDEPFWQQYLSWLTGVLHGDLGHSIRGNVSVGALIADRAVLTLQLAGLAFLFTLLIALPLGIGAAFHAGSPMDRTVSVLAVVGVGAPSFAVGMLLIYVLGVQWRLFPVYGNGDPGWDRWWHLVPPAITLAIGLAALVYKLTRTAVLNELRQDYVTFARSRGLSHRQTRQLALRNAMIPIVTSLGLVFAFLFGGTILVEVTFGLGGLGALLASSVTFKDIPVVQAITLLTAAVIALTALAVDLAYLVIDPRVRQRATS
ncbi:MAG: ABC transporter permease [Nocardioides sp.]|uniref:ABC transporter permease n=1 Tax=Nocardioides sp. TaxID=35761 RepID=UPI0039E3E45A